jgi:hypothetical protein
MLRKTYRVLTCPTPFAASLDGSGHVLIAHGLIGQSTVASTNQMTGF